MAIGGASTLLFFILGTYFLNLRAARHKRHQVKHLLETSTVYVNTIGEEVKKSSSFTQRFTQNFLPQFKSDREKKFVAISALVIFVLLFLLTKNIFFALIATAMTVVLGMKFRLRGEKDREISAFERELPAALKMLAGSLSAGLSFLQALSAYAEDGHEVSAKEFRRALGEIQLGVPIEKALESIADRMESEDLRWAVSAFAIQREVGGSLATILNSTAETIESRFELRREIQTLSAEGRISSYILMALPLGIFIFLSVIRPNYIRILMTEPLGNLLLVLTSLGLVAAWIWMKKLVRITI
jgi:tight adherence protein B